MRGGRRGRLITAIPSTLRVSHGWWRVLRTWTLKALADLFIYIYIYIYDKRNDMGGTAMICSLCNSEQKTLADLPRPERLTYLPVLPPPRPKSSMSRSKAAFKSVSSSPDSSSSEFGSSCVSRASVSLAV